MRGPSPKTYQVAGEPSREEPSGGGSRGKPSTPDAATSAETGKGGGREVRREASPRCGCGAMRGAWVLKGETRSRPNVGKRRGGCAARSRLVWLPPCVGQGAREGSGGFWRYHSRQAGVPGSSRRSWDVGRARRNWPFRVLVFLTARTELNPEDRPREAPGAHPAPGGRVHFAAQAGQLANCGWAGPLSFGGERPEVWEGDAISRRGRAGCGLFHGGGDAAEWRSE